MNIGEIVPYAQFGAAVIAIAVGGHKAIDIFLHVAPEGPVLEWNVDGFKVGNVSGQGTFTVKVSRKKLRDDCPLKSFEAQAVDSERFQHDLTTTAGKSVGSTSKDFEGFQYFARFPNYGFVSEGEGYIDAVLVYSCPEGDQIIRYPTTENLHFMVAK